MRAGWRMSGVGRCACSWGGCSCSWGGWGRGCGMWRIPCPGYHSSQQKWLKLKLKLFFIDSKGYQVVVEDVQWLHEQSAHPGSLQEPPL